jgi:hypothetical protein
MFREERYRNGLSTPDGDVLHPRLGIAPPPRLLDGPPMPALDRRLARVFRRDATANQFAHELVNRVWRHFMGRGLVEPVDDLRATNPPSNEALFDWLAQDFVQHNFDIKALIRTIMLSAAYQRSSMTTVANVKDDRFYSHYLIRRLPAEVILDAFSEVSGVPETFMGYPKGTRALQLPDTKVESYFLSVFGRPERINTSSAERMQDPTLPQALHAINGDTLNKKLMSDQGVIAQMVAAGKSNGEIEQLYLSALSRRPTDAELTGILADLDHPAADAAAIAGR